MSRASRKWIVRRESGSRSCFEIITGKMDTKIICFVSIESLRLQFCFCSLSWLSFLVQRISKNIFFFNRYIFNCSKSCQCCRFLFLFFHGDANNSLTETQITLFVFVVFAFSSFRKYQHSFPVLINASFHPICM